MDTLLSAQEVEDMAKANGLSLNELFRRADVDPTTFRRWRAEKTSPNIETYLRLVRAARGQEPAGAAV